MSHRRRSPDRKPRRGGDGAQATHQGPEIRYESHRADIRVVVGDRTALGRPWVSYAVDASTGIILGASVSTGPARR